MASTEPSFDKYYKTIDFIGKGSFGKAFTVESKINGNVFVMKKDPIPEDGKKSRREEVKALKKCSHENIVKYFEDFYEKDHTFIVMEYCSGGDLAKLIQRQKDKGTPFEDVVVISFALDLALALQYMKNKKIIHRDLKPANIFVSNSMLKIGDFGLARCMDRSSEMANSRVGTLLYMAPEILDGQPYNHRADIWSLGCILYELCTLEKPFSRVLAIATGQYKAIPHNIHPVVSQCVPDLLIVEPQRRLLSNKVIDRITNGNVPLSATASTHIGPEVLLAPSFCEKKSPIRSRSPLRTPRPTLTDSDVVLLQYPQSHEDDCGCGERYHPKLVHRRDEQHSVCRLNDIEEHWNIHERTNELNQPHMEIRSSAYRNVWNDIGNSGHNYTAMVGSDFNLMETCLDEPIEQDDVTKVEVKQDEFLDNEDDWQQVVLIDEDLWII